MTTPDQRAAAPTRQRGPQSRPQRQTAWQRSRRRLIVHAPKFVTMTDDDEGKIVHALVALLIAHLGNNTTGGRSDHA